MSLNEVGDDISNHYKKKTNVDKEFTLNVIIIKFLIR